MVTYPLGRERKSRGPDWEQPEMCGKAYSSVDQLRKWSVAVMPKMDIHFTLLDTHK